jgi:hypothetical protein
VLVIEFEGGTALEMPDTVELGAGPIYTLGSVVMW